ncbi:PREDICTED: uncharacterized protein LOC108977930 isoform X1 [Bactrocera latifrons]|uniref:DPH4 n=1 Tax=Bactrocera latifrons TaxID=174628 RepID=A0A0K8U7P2_BACLA|nr:PREDICTED: uncharacterized protein LOC108977930 isoform X1 [Bactrocera latifrons]
MPTKSFYEILNCKPTASFEELRRTYKQLILQCHPDKLQHINNIDTKTKRNAAIANDDNATTITNITPVAVDINAEILTSTSSDQNSEQFVAINEAWNTLKDPVKRRHYDAELLLRKFQTHSNIFARLTLDDMKRCAATAKTNRGSDSGSDSEVACEDGIECKSIAGDMYWYYTYDCRCGGQYIVDESVDSEILNRNQKRTPNRHSASKTSEEKKLTQQQKQNNSDKNIQAAADSGAENASTSKCANNSKSVGTGVHEDIQGPDAANRDVDDSAVDDEDSEVLVECSECSLVIVLT